MSFLQNKYLVIDYGSHTIKGVLFESGPLGERILRTESLPIAKLEYLGNNNDMALTNGSVKTKEEAKVSAKKNIPVKEDEIWVWSEYEYNIVRFVQSFFPFETSYILHIPLETLHIRDITIPVIKKTKLNHEAISFQVEDELPFNLEKLEVVGHIWTQNAENAQVLSFGAERSLLQNIVTPLLIGKTALLYIIPDAVLLASFIRIFKPDFYEKRCIGQIDVGASSTTLNVIYEGKLAFTRSLPWGGNELTSILANNLNISFEQAEKKKLELEIDLLNSKERPEVFYKNLGMKRSNYLDFSTKIKEWLQEISIEIERSFIALRCPIPEDFYISGGTAKIKHLENVLSEFLNKNVVRYPISLSTNEAPELWITALGAREIKSITKENRDNFLDTSFGSTLSSQKFDYSIFRIPITLMLATLFIFLGALGLGIVHDYKQIKINTGQIMAFGKTIPEIKVSEEPNEILSQAHSICQKRLRGASRTKTKFLQVLNELNKVTPGQASVDLEFRRLNYDGTSIELEVDLGNVGLSTTLQEKLSESKLFKNIEVKDRNILPNQKARVVYRLEKINTDTQLFSKNSCE